MLYVFHGTDTAQTGTKARTLLASLRAKKTDAAFVTMDASSWNPSFIQEHAGGQGLFSNKYIVFLDRVTENASAKESLADFTSLMKESPNIFIISEGKVLADLKKAFDKDAEKIVESILKEDASLFKKKDFNIFALADAVGARDPFKSWAIYRQAIDAGIEAENIIGTLFWQVKSMLIASQAKTAGESGLNPFVFSKSKKYADNFARGELSGLLNRLIVIYHDGHRGLLVPENALERELLAIGKKP